MPAPRSPITQWLEEVLRTGTTRPVYLGHAPKAVKYPFIVIHSIAGGATNGSLLDGADMPTFVYQIDSVGKTHKSAEDLADLAADLVCGGVVTNPAGVVVCDRIPDGAPGGVEVTGEAPLEVYAQQTRYAITVTG